MLGAAEAARRHDAEPLIRLGLAIDRRRLPAGDPALARATGALGKLLEDARDLGWCFALRQNYFGNAYSQGAVMVYFGKSQILERKMP